MAAGTVIDQANPVVLCAGVDELAVYETALTPSLIYAHYVEAVHNSTPYGPRDPGGPVPDERNPDGDNASNYDANDYPMGTVLPSPGGHAHPPKPGGGGNGTVCDGCMTCVDQARYVPDPRFDAGALATYKTPYNFNWMDPWHYMVGLNVPRAERVNATVDLVAQLAARWRYGLSLGSTDALNASIDLANAHPEWPLHGVIPGERGQLLNASLPKGCFMQDAAGHLITIKGDRCRPAASRRCGRCRPRRRPRRAAPTPSSMCPTATPPAGRSTLAKTGRLHAPLTSSTPTARSSSLSCRPPRRMTTPRTR